MDRTERIERRKNRRRESDLDSAFNDGYRLSPLLKRGTWLHRTLWGWALVAWLVGTWVMVTVILHGISIAWHHLFAPAS